MKQHLISGSVTVLLIALLSFGAAPAQAAAGSAFGALATAKAVGQGVGYFGGGIGIADATSFFGTFTYGTSQYTDIKLKLGLIDGDGSDTKFVLGTDFKWQYLSTEEDKTPVDLAFGGLLEYVSYDYASVFQIGTFVTSSLPLTMAHGGKLVPYGRFDARLESISFDRPPGYVGDNSDSNLEVGFHGGVKWEPTPTMSVYGELQLDGNNGLFLGIDFNVM